MAEERVYYRHIQTGDRYYLVEKDGKKRVRSDTGVGELPFSEHEFIPDRETRPLTGYVLAEAAFAADKAICRGLGLHRLADRDWRMLSDEARLAWTEDGPGPKADPARKDAWVAIVGALRKYTVP